MAELVARRERELPPFPLLKISGGRSIGWPIYRMGTRGEAGELTEE